MYNKKKSISSTSFISVNIRREWIIAGCGCMPNGILSFKRENPDVVTFYAKPWSIWHRTTENRGKCMAVYREISMAIPEIWDEGCLDYNSAKEPKDTDFCRK